jgi:hypothetical protein
LVYRGDGGRFIHSILIVVYPVRCHFLSTFWTLVELRILEMVVISSPR